MHGEEKEEEEDTRKCIRFESYSQHGIGFSFASRCWKVEGGTNWRGWLAGWLAFCSMLRAAFCGLRIPSCTTRGKTPLQHRDKSRGEARGDGGRVEEHEERRRERREPVRKNGGGKKEVRSAEGRRGKYGGGQKDIRRN